jgi:hypothetical protein
MQKNPVKGQLYKHCVAVKLPNSSPWIELSRSHLQLDYTPACRVLSLSKQAPKASATHFLHGSMLIGDIYAVSDAAIHDQ